MIKSTQELIHEWKSATPAEQHALKDLYGLKVITDLNRLPLSYRIKLEKNRNECLPALNENNEIVLITDYPISRIVEAREYQVRATNEKGDVLKSRWFEKEDEALKLLGEIDETDDYESVEIIKRIAGAETDEDEEEEYTLGEEYIEEKKTFNPDRPLRILDVVKTLLQIGMPLDTAWKIFHKAIASRNKIDDVFKWSELEPIIDIKYHKPLSKHL